MRGSFTPRVQQDISDMKELIFVDILKGTRARHSTLTFTKAPHVKFTAVYKIHWDWVYFRNSKGTNKQIFSAKGSILLKMLKW